MEALVQMTNDGGVQPREIHPCGDFSGKLSGLDGSDLDPAFLVERRNFSGQVLADAADLRQLSTKSQRARIFHEAGDNACGPAVRSDAIRIRPLIVQFRRNS